ncbi:MAG: polysaccharide deacetylase [Lachnospiraceae bacterium]|jgi:peptidoglycan/xylan/chitin deacetylase (PgdA/CDA1 family)|nr:polysaccharide deacetylase [Lachnospiraceae bacterium]MDD7327623.1 polysaccharide deacetylase [Lachnospiraceae bacterium]MDY2759321.1 polysaccharide deacetylase family protein [Lachnospiraceae bacterium]
MDDQDAIEKKRKQISRVHRTRNLIIFFLVVWIIFSICAIAFLGYSVHHLNGEIEKLNETIRYMSSHGTATSSGDALTYDYDLKLNSYQTDEDNLAGEDDVRKVYLTFDDGPSKNTDKILDILDDYSVKATFFVNGRTDKHSLKMYKRIVNEGHTIGMHSYTHKYSDVYASEKAFEKDFFRIRNLIYDTTGVKSMYYRFPGGSSNKVSNTNMSDLIRFLDKEHVEYFDWNVMSGDATSNELKSSEIIENVMSDVVKYKTSVVLMHDAANKDTTVAALPELIQKLQKEGDLLLPIDQDTKLIQHVTLSNK